MRCTALRRGFPQRNGSPIPFNEFEHELFLKLLPFLHLGAFLFVTLAVACCDRFNNGDDHHGRR